MYNSKIEINLLENSELLNNFNFVKYCLKNNIITQETIIGGRTLLDYSIVNKRRNFLDLLLQNKVDINIKSDNRTPLYISCLDGFDNIDIIDELLSLKADPNIIDDRHGNSQSPLYIAIWNKNHTLVKKLLLAKADPNLGNKDRTPLHLLTHPLKIPLCDRFSLTGNESINCIKFLINSNADLTKRNSNGETVIMSSCKYGNYHCLKILLQYGFKKMTIDDRNYSMNICCENNHSSCLNLLLKYKCSPNIKDKDNSLIPINEAVKNNSKNCINNLISYKVNINNLDKDNKRPLHYAIDNNNKDIIKLLLINKAFPRLGVEDEINVIDYAINEGNSDIVNLLQNNSNYRKRKR